MSPIVPNPPGGHPQPSLCSLPCHKRRGSLGMKPLKWEHCCFMLNLPPTLPNTDSRMEQAQALETEPPTFDTKHHLLLCRIYLTSLTLRFLHLQNKTHVEGWRPHEVIYGKHVYVCDGSKHVWTLLAPPSFCMMTCPGKCGAQSVITHSLTHSSPKGMGPIHPATGDLIHVVLLSLTEQVR